MELLQGLNFQLQLETSAAANQSNSVAIGYNTTANGIYSITMGNNIAANSFGELAFGQWSDASTGTVSSWNENDLLLSVGNGVNDANRSNAMKWTLLDVNTAKDFEDLKRLLSENEKRRSAVIGKAVESFSGTETGEIMVLISLQ